MKFRIQRRFAFGALIVLALLASAYGVFTGAWSLAVKGSCPIFLPLLVRVDTDARPSRADEQSCDFLTHE